MFVFDFVFISFKITWRPSTGKELPLGFPLMLFFFYAVSTVCVPFPFKVSGTGYGIQLYRSLIIALSSTSNPQRRDDEWFRVLKMIWATSWENLFMPYVNNWGADQPAHPHSLISIFVICYLDSIIPLVSISEISSLSKVVSVAEQVSLRLTW